MRNRALIPWFVLACTPGCGEWPRFANLPDEEQYPSSMSPADVVEIEWVRLGDERAGELNDLPTDENVVVLDLLEGQGVWTAGTLEGLGWSGEAEPEEITSSCGVTGVRSPVSPGDYLGDVDFVRTNVPAGSTFCGVVAIDGATYGWDFVPQETDSCGVPVGPVLADGVPLGADLGGAEGGWGFVATAEAYAVGLAGYYPDDPALTVSYAFGVAVVAPGPDGGPALCPSLPEEAGVQP